jgi:hypothetical protein
MRFCSLFLCVALVAAAVPQANGVDGRPQNRRRGGRFVSQFCPHPQAFRAREAFDACYYPDGSSVQGRREVCLLCRGTLQCALKAECSGGGSCQARENLPAWNPYCPGS